MLRLAMRPRSTSSHLAELEFVVGEHGEHQLGLLDAGVGALEVEAVGDFLVGLLDRVLHFLAVHLRDDVEGGHATGRVLP